MSKEIHVNVWLKGKSGDENENIMSFSHSSYPSYKTGDTIFIEKIVQPSVPDNISKGNPPIRLTEYVILDIHHSVRQWFSGNDPDTENPFPFKIINYLSMDMFVAENNKRVVI